MRFPSLRAAWNHFRRAKKNAKAANNKLNAAAVNYQVVKKANSPHAMVVHNSSRKRNNGAMTVKGPRALVFPNSPRRKNYGPMALYRVKTSYGIVNRGIANEGLANFHRNYVYNRNGHYYRLRTGP
jgi:hypothetical protein